MPDDHKQAFLEHLYEELELRVGTRLSEGMTDAQLAEFEKLIDAKDEKGAGMWLYALDVQTKDYRRVGSGTDMYLALSGMANPHGRRLVATIAKPSAIWRQIQRQCRRFLP